MESNKLIAEFMGYKFYNNLPQQRNGYQLPKDKGTAIYLAYSTSELQYHKDWNWLMPAVEKIEFEHDCLVIINSPLQVIITNKDIGQRETPLLDEVFEIEVSDRGTKRDCLYKAIVEFINEYNRTDDHRNI